MEKHVNRKWTNRAILLLDTQHECDTFYDLKFGWILWENFFEGGMILMIKIELNYLRYHN